MSNSTPTLLTSENVQQFLNSFDHFIFDCDGVLWRGDHMIEGADKALDMLSKQGKGVYYITNNSTTTRKKYEEKITKFGIHTTLNHIYCSAYTLAAYLQSINFNKKVYVIGEIGLIHEIEAVGISVYNSSMQHNRVFEWHEVEQIEPDPEIGAIVCGLDRNINYYKLSYAFACLQNTQVMYIASNMDETLPGVHGKYFPGSGACSAPISVASGRTPINLGKPHTWSLDLLVKEHNLDKSKTIMVGDRLDTDIMLGINGGIKTLLVLTGVSTKEQMLSSNNQIQPTYYIDSIGNVPNL